MVAFITVSSIAAVFTLIITPIEFYEMFVASEGVRTSMEPSEPTPATMTPALGLISSPTAIPTPQSLQKMLKAAKSLRYFSERDYALWIVAETAVSKGEYEIATEAGASSSLRENNSKTLTFVALCAARAGLFDEAMEAADRIVLSDAHDATKIKVLHIKSGQETSDTIRATGVPIVPDCH